MKFKTIAYLVAIASVIAVATFTPEAEAAPYAPLVVVALLAGLGCNPTYRLGAVVAEAYVEHFDRNFSEIKDEMYEQFPKQYTFYMKVEETSKAFVKKSYMGGLGMPLPNRDLENIPFQEPVKGPISFFTPTNYRLGYQIEKQTIEQEEFGLLGNRPRTMLYGSVVLMEMAAANLFNNGFTVQPYDFKVTGDPNNQPLFSINHLREDTRATWANLINQNLPITVETVFQAIVSLLYNMVDSRGLPISYSGQIYIYVPTLNPVLWQQAVEVANSVMNPGTSDNKTNALLKTFQINVVPLRFLTNPDHWFLGWSPNSPNYGLTMIVNIYPDISPLKEFGNNPDAWFSRLRTRFVAGYENKRGIAAVGA
jgi:hypothetical protein